MKVKELIEKLQKFDGDLPVYCEVCCEGYIEKVEEVEFCCDSPNRTEPEMDFIYIVPKQYF